MTNLNHRRVRFGPFEADLCTRELWRHGIRIKLGGQPYQILIALLTKPGELVTREELRKLVWADDTFVDFSHGLNAAVNKLRETLCDSPEAPRYIETLPRRGYRFIAKVEELAEVSEVPATLPVEAPIPPVAERPATPLTIALDRSRPSIRLVSLVVPFLLITVGVIGFHRLRSTSGPSPEEIERFQKQGAEIAQREMELRSKQQEEARSPGVSIAYSAKDAPSEAERAEDVARRREESLKSPQAPQPQSAANSSSSSESLLLRLTRRGRILGILPEISTDQKPSILRVDLRHIEDPHAVSKVLGGWDAISGPQPSPDGKKLAFAAGRTDSEEIWVCNIDGSSPRMLTNLRSVGTPRWSPDSRWIAFDSDGRSGHSAIFVVSADGGPARAVVQDESNNSVPSWSRDGKYIYFASNRGMSWESEQLWKVAAAGGEPSQVTYHGGFSAFESPDGKIVYYAKHRYQHPEIWQVPANGGAESRVALVHPSTWASWAVTKNGILLLSEYESSASQLVYFDFASRSVHPLATLQKASFWLAASADGSSVWYSELTDNQARQVFTASMD